MNKENRINEITTMFTSFERQSYYKRDLLPELLKLQDEVVDIVFNRSRLNINADKYGKEINGIISKRILDAKYALNNKLRELCNNDTQKIQAINHGCWTISNTIAKIISGDSGENRTYKALEASDTGNILIKNLEFDSNGIHSEIDCIMITPKCLFLLEIKNPNLNVSIDSRGNYYRHGKRKILECNITEKMNMRYAFIKRVLSSLGLRKIKVVKLVVFTNSEITPINNCKHLDHCTLSQLPGKIDNFLGDDIYTAADMQAIADTLEAARIEYTYPFEMDVNNFKHELACLIADLEEIELEKNGIEAANEKQEIKPDLSEAETSNNTPVITHTVNKHKILKGFTAVAASAAITIISVLGFRFISK